MLEPVRGVGEGVEIGGVAIAEAVVAHFWEEEGIAHAPEDARGDVDLCVRELGAIARGGAIPIDHGG